MHCAKHGLFRDGIIAHHAKRIRRRVRANHFVMLVNYDGSQRQHGKQRVGGIIQCVVIGIMLMPLISAALQFLMTRISMKTNGNSNMNGSSKAMLYMMPLMTVWMGYILPAALCVYWIANAAFSCIQEQVLNKHFSKVLDREETDKERQKREARYAKMQAARENYNRQLEQQAQSKGGKKPQPQPKKKKTGESTTEAGKVGNRPYARGRAYREEHYDE